MKKFELSEEELNVLLQALDDHCFEYEERPVQLLYDRLKQVKQQLQQEDEEES